VRHARVGLHMPHELAHYIKVSQRRQKSLDFVSYGCITRGNASIISQVSFKYAVAFFGMQFRGEARADIASVNNVCQLSETNHKQSIIYRIASSLPANERSATPRSMRLVFTS
jgi:hypothetical protein